MKVLQFHVAGKTALALAGLTVIIAAVLIGEWIPPGLKEPRPVITRDIYRASLSDGKGGMTRPLRVAIRMGGGFAGGIVANGGLRTGDGPISRDQGIRAEFIIMEDDREVLQSLALGRVDVTCSSPETLALAYPQMAGVNPAAFFLYAWSEGEDLMLADGSMTSLAELKGKIIACPENTSPHFLAMEALSRGGLALTDARWRLAGTSRDALDLFESGKADVAAVRFPLFRESSLKRSGAKILFSTRDSGPLMAGILVARESFLLVNREIVRKFLLGCLEGAEACLADPEVAAQALAGAFAISPDEAKAMMKSVKPAVYRDNLEFFGITTVSSLSPPAGFNSLFEKSSLFWEQSGRIKSRGFANLARNTGILVSLEKSFLKTKRKAPGIIPRKQAGS